MAWTIRCPLDFALFRSLSVERGEIVTLSTGRARDVEVKRTGWRDVLDGRVLAAAMKMSRSSVNRASPIAVAGVLLALAAAVGCYIPARTAARADPVEALRRG